MKTKIYISGFAEMSADGRKIRVDADELKSAISDIPDGSPMGIERRNHEILYSCEKEGAVLSAKVSASYFGEIGNVESVSFNASEGCTIIQNNIIFGINP